MRVRFGYVAMSMMLQDASPSKAVTYAAYQKLAAADPGAAFNKVRRVAGENINNCLRLLRHNKACGVQVFRFSSRIIPLGTHPELVHWDYAGEYSAPLQGLGKFVMENRMRVSFHPDHFAVLNTPGEETFQKTLLYLDHHVKLFSAMGLGCDYKLVIHVGGGYRNKGEALERFKKNWERVPPEIRCRIALENDDKIFTAGDVLDLCRDLKLPMVLDIHHFRCCRREDEGLPDLLPGFLSTWEGTRLNPKIHVSSPRSKKNFLSHHDYVDPGDVYPFLALAREHGVDLDVMVEAKQKDLAMFKLVRDLGRYPGVEVLGDAAVRLV